MKLSDSVVLVTGGASGLGLVMAEYLADDGARVVIADIDEAALAALDDRFDTRVLDVTDMQAVDTVVDEIYSDVGEVSVLINNAGVIYSEPMINIMNPESMMHDYERFRKYVTVNMDSVFMVTSAVVRNMVMKRVRGVVINISSISANGNEGQIAYSAAKGGVNAMTKTWSKELARFGIRCNAIAPGFIGTESTHEALDESIVKHITEETPLRRLGEATEVAMAAGSLIENDFLNGVILGVDGGLVI